MKRLLLSVTALLTSSMFGNNDSIRMEDISYLRPYLENTPFESMGDDIEIAGFIRVCEKSSHLTLRKTTDCQVIRSILTNAFNELLKNKNTPQETLKRISETAVLIERRAILDTINHQIAQGNLQR